MFGGSNGVPPAETAGWLAYLRDHFLRTGARAAGLDGAAAEAFAEFGFDHTLEGAVAVWGDQSGELTLIRLAGDMLSTEVVAPAA